MKAPEVPEELETRDSLRIEEGGVEEYKMEAERERAKASGDVKRNVSGSREVAPHSATAIGGSPPDCILGVNI